VTGRLAGSVEHRGDCLVRHLARQGTNEVDYLHIGSPSRLAGAVSPYRKARVIAALPVDDQLQNVADDIDDDLGDDCANDLLARLRRSAGAPPSSNQVLTERHEPLAIGLSQSRRLVSVESIDLEFKIAYRDKALVPSPLQLTGHQAVLRISGVILALRPGGLVAGLL